MDNSNRSGTEYGQLFDRLGDLNDDYDGLRGSVRIHTFMVVFTIQYLQQVIGYLNQNIPNQTPSGSIVQIFVVSIYQILLLIVHENCIAVLQLQLQLQLRLQLQLQIQIQIQQCINNSTLQNCLIGNCLKHLLAYQYIILKVQLIMLLLMQLNIELFKKKMFIGNMKTCRFDSRVDDIFVNNCFLE